MNEEATPPTQRSSAAPTLARRLLDGVRRPGSLLLVLTIGAGALMLYLSVLRFYQLQSGTWDLGLYQQALYSTAHGRPFYEAADLETGGFGSFLQVHSAFVLYALVPLYNAFPSPISLFVIQAIVVVAAALPLYLLARDVTASSRKALLAAGLYLLGAATLTSALYDFHIEAFVPLEYFGFVLVFQRRQYLLAVMIAAVAFLTMESLPVLLFAVGAFFAIPPLLELGRRWALVRRMPTGRSDPGEAPSGASNRIVLVACALLMGGCLLAYYLLVAIRVDWIAGWLGFSAFPSGATSSGYIVGTSAGQLGLAVSNLGISFYSKLMYWLLLFALLGFVPFLSPRTLVLSAPWIAFTFFSADTNLTTIGFQYGFLAGPPLMLGFVFGIRRLDARVLRQLLGVGRASPSLPWRSGGIPKARTDVLALVAVASLVGVNLLVSPLNPNMQGPTLGAAYRGIYNPSPGFASVERLAALIPDSATVLASDDLFPLVANNLHAYSFLWAADPSLRLPFNSSDPPSFVFLSESRIGAVAPWVVPLLYNTSEFGVRGTVFASPAGPVLLFERGYSGSALDLAAPESGTITLAPSAFQPGVNAYLAVDRSTPFGATILGAPGSTGLEWQGPYGTVPAGRYDVSVYLKMWATEPTAHPVNRSNDVAVINANAFGQSLWFSLALPFGALAHANYTAIHVALVVPGLSIGVMFRGYVSDPNAGMGFAGIVLTPVSG